MIALDFSDGKLRAGTFAIDLLFAGFAYDVSFILFFAWALALGICPLKVLAWDLAHEHL